MSRREAEKVTARMRVKSSVSLSQSRGLRILPTRHLGMSRSPQRLCAHRWRARATRETVASVIKVSLGCVNHAKSYTSWVPSSAAVHHPVWGRIETGLVAYSPHVFLTFHTPKDSDGSAP